jgi:hypothetical protein
MGVARSSAALLFRHGSDFCSFYLIIEYRAVLMMYGLKHALDTNVIAVAYFGVAPHEHINSAAVPGALQFE